MVPLKPCDSCVSPEILLSKQKRDPLYPFSSFNPFSNNIRKDGLLSCAPSLVPTSTVYGTEIRTYRQ
jgi:hypothetical protein